MFGQNPSPSVFEFYVFDVNTYTGEYRLTRWAPDPNDVRTFAYGTSDAVRRGTATNHIMVERSGDQITAWVNGTQVCQTSDSMFTGSRLVGLKTESSAYFDNFALCTYVQ